MSHLPLKTPAPPQGIIAALVTGFETVNARLELILLPLALDLFLWLGPHLSVQRLVPPLEAALRAMAAPAGADPVTRQNLETLLAALQIYGASFNVLSFLSTTPLGVPSLLASRSPMTVPGGLPLVWNLENLAQCLLLAATLVLAGLLLGAFYLGGIAQQVRDRKVNWPRLLRQVWGDWARLTALGALALVALTILGLPVVLVTGVTTLFSPLLGGLVWLAGVTVILWALFYGGFALHAMLLSRRGLFAALWDSARLVQINLPQAAGLFVLVVLINAGLGVVWSLPQPDSWLLLLGLGGHALISTALVAATFVFFQDRYRWWIEMRQTLRARAEAEQRGRHSRQA